MAGSIVLKLACVMVACMVVYAPYAEAAITCGIVVSKLSPCLPYLQKGGAVPPPACCAGIKSLNALAKTTPDRQNACNCIKKAAAGVSVQYAGPLPGKCGVSIPYKISPSTDCNKVV